MNFFDKIKIIYNKLKNTTGGKNVDYIPELENVDTKLYAISIYTVDGEEFNIGDYKHEFAIESCSKVFTLALALEKFGEKKLKKEIGQLKSKEKFNSIYATHNSANHTINSFNNGGAMATTCLLYDPNTSRFNKSLLDNISNFAGRKLHVDEKIYTSEIQNSEHNLKIAYLLKSYDRFYGDVKTCLDVYTRQCSVMVTTKDLALMAATFANNGKQPKTKKQLISKKNVEYIINHLHINGLYNESEKWMKEVGIHIKSGVSGVLLIVIPGIMGIGIASSPLNKYGNSVKGLKTAKMIGKLLN